MNDSRLESIMGRLLQAGVLAAGLAMIVGGVYYLALHGGETADYRHFHGITQQSGEKVLWIGVILMIATPVLRVVFAVVAFALERDWLYTTVSLVVLGLLIRAFF